MECQGSSSSDSSACARASVLCMRRGGGAAGPVADIMSMAMHTSSLSPGASRESVVDHKCTVAGERCSADASPMERFALRVTYEVTALAAGATMEHARVNPRGVQGG